MKLTVPTLLTLARIVMIPVLVVVFYLPYAWTNFACAGLFALAAITDWLDGWIARRYHQFSAFGAFLDPVADKLMVAVALFLIVQGHPTRWMTLWALVIVGLTCWRASQPSGFQPACGTRTSIAPNSMDTAYKPAIAIKASATPVEVAD